MLLRVYRRSYLLPSSKVWCFLFLFLVSLSREGRGADLLSVFRVSPLFPKWVIPDYTAHFSIVPNLRFLGNSSAPAG